MDQSWSEVVDYLKSVSNDGLGIAAHEDFEATLPAAVPYAEIGAHEPEFFSALVIHKGLYEQIEPSFLHGFLARARPTFANDVFIVLRTEGKALSSSNTHLGPLRSIAKWAASQAAPWGPAQAREPPLPADTVLAQMADFIAQNLAKPLDPTRSDSPLAIAETAERFNDTAWFWVDDSGKTAELFAVPSMRDSHRELADATLDHVLRLSPDRIIQRRCAVPELKLVDARPEEFRAYNSFFNLTGNLKAGVVRPSIRSSDDRIRFLGEYGGNVLRFIYRGRRQAVDVESAIVAWKIEERPDRLIFSHTSAIDARPLIGRRRQVCNLTYRYSLWKARPTIELEAEIVTLPDVALDAVQLSTAFDQLSTGGHFDTVVVGAAGQYQRCAATQEQAATLCSGPANYLGISEVGAIPGRAQGFHVRFRDGDKLGDIRAEGSQPGRFHWIYPRYALGRVPPGQVHKIAEDRLLTGGGVYSEPDVYRHMLERPAATADSIDPSMSCDIGAELNAVAVTILFATQGLYRSALPAERLHVLRRWYDRHLETYRALVGDRSTAATVFIRGLSFVILSLDCMVRAFATANYRARLSEYVELLLRLEHPIEGAQGETVFSVPGAPELDCHCAALLALARAAVHCHDRERIERVLRRALRGTLILTLSGDQYGHPEATVRSLAIRTHAGAPPQDGGFWTFKVGLALRAFNAIRQLQAAGVLSLDERTLAHMNSLTEVAQRNLLSSLRREDDTIEALTSEYSAETNSETQACAALGLVPAVEWELYGRPPHTELQLSLPAEPVATRNLDEHRRSQQQKDVVSTAFSTYGDRLIDGQPVSHVISLGTHCLTSTILKNAGLKPYSLPFDWIFSSPEMVLDCLRDDFEMLLDRRQYRSLTESRASRRRGAHHQHYLDKYGVVDVFAHRDPSTDADFQYFLRAVERFRRVLRCQDSKLFVMISRPRHDLRSGFSRIVDELQRLTTRFALLGVQLAEPTCEPGIHSLAVSARYDEHVLYTFAPSSQEAGRGDFPDKLDEWSLLRLVYRYQLKLQGGHFLAGQSPLSPAERPAASSAQRHHEPGLQANRKA